MGGTSFWGPYNKDPIFGNSYIAACGLRASGLDMFRQ